MNNWGANQNTQNQNNKNDFNNFSNFSFGTNQKPPQTNQFTGNFNTQTNQSQPKPNIPAKNQSENLLDL